MKTYLKIILLSITIVLTSCEDVIDVDVQTEPAKLTVEASLDWEKGTTGNNQTIKLTTSTPYFDKNTNVVVTGASVKVTNDGSGQEFVFADQNNGEYTTSTFVPVLNQSYTLDIIYEGEHYNATETLMPVTDITKIEQSREDGFNDEDLELQIFFNDPESKNFYFIKVKEEADLLPILESFDDEFVNGNEVSLFYEKEEDDETDEIEAFVPGDIVNIDFFGISEGYYNYLSILIEQSEGVGLFSATPVALKGNCINQDNSENYANGYFRLTQKVKTSYTFE